MGVSLYAMLFELYLGVAGLRSLLLLVTQFLVVELPFFRLYESEFLFLGSACTVNSSS